MALQDRGFRKSRSCKSGELTTSCRTLLGVPRRLRSATAKATATVSIATESVSKIPEKFIAVSQFVLELQRHLQNSRAAPSNLKH